MTAPSSRRKSPHMRTTFGSSFTRLLAVMLAVWILGPLTVTAQQATPGPLAAPTSQPAGGFVPNAVNVAKSVNPTQLSPGEEATVTITLRGEAFEECLGAPGAPLDAILIIDNSVSGRAFGRLDKAKTTAQSFIDQLGVPVYLQWDQAPLMSRVGIVVSNYTDQGPQTELLELAEDFTAARDKLASIAGDADTGVDEGIRKASQELTSKARQQGRRMILLVLHDNVPFTSDALTEAQKAIQAGASIYVIGVGRKEDIDEKEVVKLTGESGHYLFEPRPADLFQLFVRSTGGATDLAGKDFRISDDFSPSGMVELVPGSISGRGADVKISTENGHPVWRVPLIRKGETVVLTYQVRVAPTASVGGPVNLSASTGWLCCNGCFHNWASVPGAAQAIQVLLPTATPILANAATQRPSSATPVPTETALGVVDVLSTPTATPSPKVVPVIGPIWGAVSRFLPPSLRDIFPICCPIILIIPLLWLLRRFLKRQRRQPPPQRAEEVRERPRPVEGKPVEPLAEPTPGVIPIGATRAGPEGDDEVLVRELMQSGHWQGYISAERTGLSEPWPIQVHVLSTTADLAALALRNKGSLFHWRKEDSSGVAIPVIVLEKALERIVSLQHPLVVADHARPTENLAITVDVRPNSIKRNVEIGVRAHYREPVEGQSEEELKSFVDIRVVENPAGPLVYAPILEQNL